MNNPYCSYQHRTSGEEISSRLEAIIANETRDTVLGPLCVKPVLWTGGQSETGNISQPLPSRSYNTNAPAGKTPQEQILYSLGYNRIQDLQNSPFALKTRNFCFRTSLEELALTRHLGLPHVASWGAFQPLSGPSCKAKPDSFFQKH